MKKPILVVMAAGMGSRYGGLKQMDPMGKNGEIIMDYSLYDAHLAGFERVVFVIKRELYEDFHRIVGVKAEKIMQVAYAFQELSDLPEGFSVPQGRQKPWGTGHAVLAARDKIDAPFAVINADDYYGRQAFASIYQFLVSPPVQKEDVQPLPLAMVAYILRNTLTENGSVSRGVCQVENGYLVDICERTRIEKTAGGARFTEDGGVTYRPMDPESLVSMNLWGFPRRMVEELWARFPVFLEKTMRENPLKGEFFLPFAVNDLLTEKKARVQVLSSRDQWYGVTYQEDKPMVSAALRKMAEEEFYPSPLWGKM